MAGKNIGDLLNAANITWGGFMGGFDLTASNANGTTGCARSTVSPNTNAHGDGLHAAPRLVPVLRLDRKPAAHTAELDRDDRSHRADARRGGIDDCRSTTNMTITTSSLR